MPGVLIATIGDRDPESKSAPMGPLLCAITLRPDRAVLIHTARSHVDYPANARATADRIRQSVPGCDAKCVLLEIDNPSKTSLLLERMPGILPRDLSERDEIHVCGTSGTPQMGLVLHLLAEARWGVKCVRHWQVLDPTRLPPGADRLTTLPLDRIWHHHDLQEALELLRQCRVAEALARLEPIAGPTKETGRVLDCARLVCRTLLLADAYQRQAITRLNDELQKNASQAVRSVAPRTSSLAEWYLKLARSGDRKLWAGELYARAARIAEADNVAQALVALATASEVAVAAYLKTHRGFDPESISPDALGKASAIWPDLKDRVRDGSQVDGQPSVHARATPGTETARPPRLEGWRNLYELLCKFENREADARLTAVANTRNGIVHAGTSEPSDSETLRRGLEAAAELQTSFGWPDPRTLPGHPHSVAAVAQELAKRAHIALDDL